MIAPDEITYKYLKDKEFAPKGIELDKNKNIGIPQIRCRCKL